MQVAVLDDYQDVALSMADWSAVQERAAISVFNDHVADPDRWSSDSHRSTRCA